MGSRLTLGHQLAICVDTASEVVGRAPAFCDESRPGTSTTLAVARYPSASSQSERAGWQSVEASVGQVPGAKMGSSLALQLSLEGLAPALNDFTHDVGVDEVHAPGLLREGSA